MTKIEELKAAFNAATGGEWCASQGLNNDEVKNVNFVILAHNLMPSLLEAVEALETIVDSEEYHGATLQSVADAALAKLKEKAK